MPFRVVSAPISGAFGSLIVSNATAAGLDPELVRRVVKQESGFDPNAKNAGSGATGLMQVMEGTARDPGYGVAPIVDRTDPEQNVRLGTSYLSKLKQQLGDERSALVAYNWGPGNAAKWKDAGGRDEDLPPETRDYVAKILNGYDPAAASAAPAPAAAGKKRFKVVSPPTAAPAADETPVAPAGALPAEGVRGTATLGLPPGGVTADVEGLPEQPGSSNPLDVMRSILSPARRVVAPAAAEIADASLTDPGGALASVGQSATLNTADNLVGLVSEDGGQAVRDATERFHNEHPGAALVADLGGGAVTGLGLNAGLQAVGRAAVPVVSAGARALTGFETAGGAATTARNVGRTMGQGAILGAGAAAGEGEDPLLGAVGGAAGGLVVPAAAGGASAVRRLLSSRAAGPIRALAARLGEAPEALAARWVAFQQQTGRTPSIAEVSDRSLARELGEIGATHKTAETILTAAERDASRARPNRVADIITGDNIPAPLAARAGVGGQPGNVGDETVAQSTRMTDAMDQIRGNPVSISADEFNELRASPTVRRAIASDERLQQVFHRIDQDLAPPPEPPGGWGPYGPPDPPETAELTVRDIEALRQGLGALREKATPDVLVQLNQRIGRLRDIGADPATGEPAYADALDRFGTDARRISGIEQGRQGKVLDDVTTMDLRRDLGTPEGAEGVRAGLRGRLVDDARSSENGAVRTLGSLAEDAGLAGRLRGSLGAGETERLRRTADMELTAAERLSEAASGTAPTARQKLVDLAQQTGETFATGLAPASAWYKARLATRLLRKLSMSKRTAEAIARMTTRPDQAQATIDTMLREGMTRAQIRDFFNTLAAPLTGAAVAPE